MDDRNASSTFIHLDSGSEEKLKPQRRSNNTRNKVVYFLVGAVVAMAVVSLILVLVNVQQKQKQQEETNESIMSRLEELEARISACTCQASAQMSESESVNAPSYLHAGMALKQDDLRVKREFRQFLNPERSLTVTGKPQEADLIETEHILSEHHGIAASHMALLFADPKELARISDEQISSKSPVKFKNITNDDPQCRSLKANGNGDLWCQPLFKDDQIDQYMLLDKSEHYPYLAKAPWMVSERSQEYFDVTEDEVRSLIVKAPGIYIVTSSMHFTDVTIDRVHYAVYARNHRNAITSERILGMCASSIYVGNSKGDGKICPCSTWQLAPLNEGDRVFLKINPFMWFRVQKETFFLAVIKLNDWTFDEPKERGNSSSAP